VREHAGGNYIYAAPDCPEVYFLSGLRNPTRTIYDFFDEPGEHSERVLTQIERAHVKTVVICTRPGFSFPVAPGFRKELERRFPEHETIGAFDVRWGP